MGEHITRTEAIIQGNSSSIRAFEAQLGQFASNLNTRPPSSLPSDTKNPSPMGEEHCKAITLRSGKQTDEPFIDSTVAPQDTDGVITSEKVKSEEFLDASDKEVPQIVAHMPNRFRKNEHDKQYQQFLDTLKQL
ncbi:F-box/LRR-repeat protein 13-like [Gossypium australe]|uniref:F-box/LRR-repeat protein 13-like n=1 Tax=Gossypium australe TaxID=47621 RepID=A0A5B6TZW7_9ROSI|nr:F-box/LRR-repeat protein 13-like [Gossypium australe]